MKNSLLLFVVVLVCSSMAFAQQDVKKITANFEFNWTDYLLPKCPFLIYHGKDGAHFIDSSGNRIPNQDYLNIKTGGINHFIVQETDGFHILDTDLKHVTKTAYDNIELVYGSDLKLTLGGKTTFYSWNSELEAYGFVDAPNAPMIPASPRKRDYNFKLGEVNDSRFKAKRIDKLRLGIDMTKTLTIGQKGKNLLVLKGQDVVYKGKTKPMLFNDFMITESKAPHAIYHPISKEPILENCEQFWFVGSFLVVSIKGSSQKHVLSNSGKIILSSVGEIRYYDYDFGKRHYSFFCDGRSVVNLNGNLIYRSDGELIGVAEHYIYAGHSAGYLGDLTREIKMNCTNFKRYGILTIGQTGRNQWRLFGPKSILINSFEDYFYDESDSLLICAEEKKTIVCNPYSGEVVEAHAGCVRSQESGSREKKKYYICKKNEDDLTLEGRFDPKEGILVAPKYLKIEWLESANYYVVITKRGLVRYLNSEGQALFE